MLPLNVFVWPHDGFGFGVLPDLRVGCRQKTEMEQMFGFMTTRVQPGAEARRKIRVDEKLHLPREISRCAV
jgi:hypothetical protein